MSKSLLEGIDLDILKKMGLSTTATVEVPVVAPAVKLKPGRTPKRKPGGIHKSFADQLKDDSAWLNEKLLIAKDLVCQKITVSLHQYLWASSGEIVVEGFKYQNSIMDIMAVSNDYLTEYEIKTCRQDYARDFNKLVMAGKYQLNKHSQIKKGKFITNRFYFVCPVGLIDLEHLPDYAGLMYYTDEGPARFNQFIVVKPAPLIKTEKVSPMFYRTLAFRLQAKCNHLVKKYQHKSILNFLSNVPEQNNIEHNTTNQGNINTEGQNII